MKIFNSTDAQKDFNSNEPLSLVWERYEAAKLSQKDSLSTLGWTCLNG